MESQPQNPEFRNYPENLHPCKLKIIVLMTYVPVNNFCHIGAGLPGSNR